MGVAVVHLLSLVPFFLFVSACGGTTPIALTDGAWKVDPAWHQDGPAVPPDLALTLSDDGKTATFSSGGATIGVANALTARAEAVHGCPKNMASDALAAMVVAAPLTLGAVNVPAGALLVPGCAGETAVFLTTEGNTAGPCTGSVCVRFIP